MFFMKTSDSMTLRARTSTPLAAVREALTDAAALESWLAEHAEVDLPDTFAFWGRHTPDGATPHQRLLHADDHSLRFAWRLHGVDTTVEFTLAEEGADTVISLVQSDVPPIEDAIRNTGPLSILVTFWSLAIANLVDHVEGRATTPKCDFTATAELREEITVGAAPEEVYRSLMEPDRFRRWFGFGMSVEPREGGRWAMGDDFSQEHSVARIIELDPGRKVTLEWPGMISTWELAGADGRTRLTFVHSGFDETNPPHADWTGWLSGMAALRRFHELPAFRPIWLAEERPGADTLVHDDQS